MTTELRMLDLFAGTGVGVAASRMGIKEWGVEIMPAAIATRDAAGFDTPYYDAWEIDKAEDLDFNTLWASPPCQTFSVAGGGSGRKALDDVIRGIREERWKDIESLKRLGAEVGDDRTALVLTPLAYVHRYRPTYVALEQVPAVLPVWEAYVEPLEEMGYSVWTGFLNSEEYRAPQTRKRAYLIARKDGRPAAPPVQTGQGSTMAEAIGWGLTGRQSPTLTSHLGVTRSPSGTQNIYRKAIEAGNFIFKPVEPVHSKIAKNGIGSEYAPNTINIDVNEGGILQSYPDGFPFQGTSSERQLQVGNAVPPLVAEAVLRAFLDD